MSEDEVGDVIASTCSSTTNNCPTIFKSARADSVVVQGYLVTDGNPLPSDEGRVRIPAELIRQAYRALVEDPT